MLAAVALFHLGSVLLGPELGALSVDERTYWWMTRSLVQGRGFTIDNGFAERASPELVAAALVEREGRLVPSPPYLFPFLAAPFYAALGFRGLFLVNALAFVATLALTLALARELGMERRRALDAALILGLATYLGDYAQAAWPHALATAWLAATAWAALRGERTARVGDRASLASGLLAGFATGVRLDLVLLAPIVVAAPLAARPARWRRAGLAALGLLPGLALLAWTNRVKFGAWSPLSYGRQGAPLVSGVGEYLPVAALGLLVLTVAGTAFGGVRLPRVPRVGIAVAAAAALLAWSASRAALTAWANGFWQLVVDLRWRDPSLVEPVLERGPGGALAYLGAVKKSLLQSCPYLMLLVGSTPPREWPRRIVLVGTPLLFVGFYAAFAWHGGLALNLRYWTPVLPFLAIGVAGAGSAIAPGGGRAALVAAAATVVGLTAFAAARPDLGMQEPVYLTAPLALALLLAAAAVAARSGIGAAVSVPATRILAAVGLAWAGCVVFTWDLPHATGWRRAHAAVTLEARDHVPDRALFVTPYLEPFFGLIERDALLADPTRDGYADFPALARFHLERGRPVRAALRAEIWDELAGNGRLAGLVATPLWREPHFVLCRLELAP